VSDSPYLRWDQRLSYGVTLPYATVRVANVTAPASPLGIPIEYSRYLKLGEIYQVNGRFIIGCCRNTTMGQRRRMIRARNWKRRPKSLHRQRQRMRDDSAVIKAFTEIGVPILRHVVDR